MFQPTAEQLAAHARYPRTSFDIIMDSLRGSLTKHHDATSEPTETDEEAFDRADGGRVTNAE